MMRIITESQAKEARKILIEECGMYPEREDRCGFLYHVTRTDYPCQEYRFMGALGFGGKFRNNGNRNNTPYVDCYRENETPERLEMIDRANKRLAELFR